ncbi:hypothetical protein PFICI_09803 [Pestalotiopsis fici W106-1]|uniref:Uncharacterized protein n=1 Tax=Pestalotiopsis fici (strain W106-1 / CGMCC3.15140) TaxID=1229662 RepID=W3WXZ3_PESFW|nr:uncharacterized protein PFICI_09803 [Pestalotiopsis fici W106-1]ETS77741.1 hypothetical protein PFICI_09803 [Pestalotiopsis fici W106-1]
MASTSRPNSLGCADDCFYSFPPSRVASYEDNTTPKGSAKECDRTPRSTCSFDTALDKDASLESTSQQHERVSDTQRSSRVKWTLPFPHHEESSTQHHFCSKPVLDRLSRHRLPSGFDHPTDGSHVPDFASLPDEPLTIEQLVSSPAAPVTTKHWSSTSIGSSMRAAKSQNSRPVYFDPSTGSTRGVEDIVANIRTYLSTMRHDACDASPREQLDSMTFVAQDQDSRPKSTSENFLVSTNDIAGILDIVIVGLRRLHREHLPSGCLSVLLPWDHNKRPIVTKADSIFPTASCPAEPATTISSVKPTVTPAFSSHLQSMANKSIKATIITKRSVAEVS